MKMNPTHLQLLLPFPDLPVTIEQSSPRPRHSRPSAQQAEIERLRQQLADAQREIQDLRAELEPDPTPVPEHVVAQFAAWRARNELAKRLAEAEPADTDMVMEEISHEPKGTRPARTCQKCSRKIVEGIPCSCTRFTPAPAL